MHPMSAGPRVVRSVSAEGDFAEGRGAGAPSDLQIRLRHNQGMITKQLIRRVP